HRILVPLDGSELAEAVLPHASMLAQRLGATIELVRAYAPPAALLAAAAASAMPGTGPGLDPGPYLAAGREEAETYLGEVAERLRGRGVGSERRGREGAAGEEIVAEGARGPADLVAMTTHGRGGLGRLAHGSVATHVASHAPCAVLMVRPNTPPPA